MRKLILNNTKLKDILEKRGKIFLEMGEIERELVECDKERTKLAYQLNKLKEKTEVILKKEVVDLTEFEVITKVFLDEEGNPALEIVDRLEEYKDIVRTKK